MFDFFGSTLVQGRVSRLKEGLSQKVDFLESGILDSILNSVTDSPCEPPKLHESLNVSASFTLPIKVSIAYIMPSVWQLPLLLLPVMLKPLKSFPAMYRTVSSKFSGQCRSVDVTIPKKEL